MSEPPLAGVRVIDLGHALAGPFAATLLGDFGAEVLKIERPVQGDPMRNLGPKKDGHSLWWKAAARNKKSVTLDFTKPRGREILLDLVKASDVLIENFRPGTLERHGLGWNTLHETNRRLVVLQISGFGQTGPHRGRPGFGRTAEAMSGAAYLTGFPEGPPVHVGYSLADTLTGLMGAFGVLLCLLSRGETDDGDCVDVALYEPLFRLIDWQAILYDQLGEVPVRAGNGFPAVLEGVAAGVAQTSNGVWMSYSAATDSVLERLIRVAFGDAALAESRFATSDQRRLRTADVQDAINDWIGAHDDSEVERIFAENNAVIGPVYDIERIWSDVGYRARGNLIKVLDDDLGEVTMHGVVPHVVGNPGGVRSTGPELGKQTEEVLGEILSLDSDELAELRREGVI